MMGSRDLPYDYTRATALVDALFAEYVRPPANLTVSQWAHKNGMPSVKVSGEPGHWRTERMSYLRQILDDLSALSTVQEVAVMFAAQLGKSETGNYRIGFTLRRITTPRKSACAHKVFVIPSQDQKPTA
jgi:phage terminase large subunit GpA-like protein